MIFRVLATVTSWDVPAEPHPPIGQVLRTALVDDVTAWSGLPRDQVDAAVRACTLSAQQVRDEGLRYWQLRERSARLALRPLIEPPQPAKEGELWLLPRCAHRTQYLLLTYLNDQQLPWPDTSLPKPVLEAVKAWHKLAEDHLEAELASVAAAAGLAFQASLKENKATVKASVFTARSTSSLPIPPAAGSGSSRQSTSGRPSAHSKRVPASRTSTAKPPSPQAQPPTNSPVPQPNLQALRAKGPREHPRVIQNTDAAIRLISGPHQRTASRHVPVTTGKSSRS